MHRHRQNHMLLMGRRQPAPQPATLDDATDAFMTLSNGDLTAALSGGWRMIYATLGKTSGEHSFQMRFDSGSYAIIGFDVYDGANVHDYPGEDGETGYGISSHGYSFTPSGTSQNGITFTSGDYALGVLDWPNNRAKFYKLVSGAWSLVYNADISAAAGEVMYPVVALFDGTVTVNFGQSAFQAAPPGGYPEGVYP